MTFKLQVTQVGFIRRNHEMAVLMKMFYHSWNRFTVYR